MLICGASVVKIASLQANTEYRNYEASDTAVKHFWAALETFTQAELRLFLRFFSGRSRAPADKTWGMKLLLMKSNRGDSHLPVAHTCQASIEWPNYSTEEIATDKLRKAILLCGSMENY
jgi:hypothetical protein